MNLKLEKIKRKNLIDYNIFSGYIKKKKGKIIFTPGLRSLVKLRVNEKLSFNEEFERKFQFNSIIRNFNEEFHKKRINKNNSINNKSITSRIFLHKNIKTNNDISYGNKTLNYFFKTKKIIQKPNRIRSCIYYRNKDFPNLADSHINLSKANTEKINNNINYKEIYDEYKRIKNIINNSVNYKRVNNNEIKINDRINKSKSAILISNIKKDKLKFIKGFKSTNQNQNKSNKDKNKQKESNFNKFLNHKGKININKSFIEQVNKKYEMSSIEDNTDQKYIFTLKNKSSKKSISSNLEDDSKIDLNIFKDYDEFNPTKAYSELKDNYDFIVEKNNEKNLQYNRIKYLWDLRNFLNRKPGIKLIRNIRLSEKRINNLKRHDILK